MTTAYHRASRGFTLLELLVTVTAGVVLLALAPPSFIELIRGVRLKSQMYDFNGALELARSEAVKRGTWVTLCKSANQTSCGTGGTQWENGWIVFVDKNNNQTVDVGEDAPLRTAGALVAGYTMRAPSASTLAGYITFNAKGVSSAGGQFVLCKDAQINPARAVLVSLAGRITTAALHNNVPVNADGTDMTTCTP